MRFLVDECLTLELVEEAHAFGFEAYHLAHLGKAGWKDWRIAAFAATGDLVLVTNNAADFLKIYGRRPVHPGLVIIIPSVPAAAERTLFKLALGRLGDIPDLLNKVLEVDFGDTGAALRIYDFPAP